MTTEWKEKLAVWEKKVSLLKELIALEEEHGDVESADASPRRSPKAAKPRKPAKSKEKPAASNYRGKEVSLPELLERIGAQHKRSFRYEELAVLVKAAGYASESDNFNNMIYQALQKLTKRGSYVKDPDTRLYRYVGRKPQ